MEVCLNAVFQIFPKMEKFGNGTCQKNFKKHLTNRTIYGIIIIINKKKGDKNECRKNKCCL